MPLKLASVVIVAVPAAISNAVPSPPSDAPFVRRRSGSVEVAVGVLHKAPVGVVSVGNVEAGQRG